MITKNEKDELLKIQIKKYWIPFIFIILCIINISSIPKLLESKGKEKKINIVKSKIKKYNEKEENERNEIFQIIFHEKKEKEKLKKEKKEEEIIKKRKETAHYVKTAIYVIVILCFILFSIIFLAKANMQSNIPLPYSNDPRIEGYINLPDTIENYQLIS